jgi:diacylglycerol kinase (ATP)
MAAIPLINNPKAGGSRGLVRLREAESLLALKGIEVKPVNTERPGHATELARKLAEDGAETVLVLGGDGTLSEAANGILQLPEAERPRLGFLPAGTGNDFLRDFGVFDLETAARNIALGRETRVDAAHVTWPGGERFMINILGTALAAKSVDRCNRKYKWMGKRGYDAAAMVEIARTRDTPTRIVLDGAEVRGDFPLVIVCNTVHTGGAMKMAPGAKPTDGVFDVVTVEGAGPLHLLYLLAAKLRKGEHVNDAKVRIRRAANISIEPRDPSPLLIDGEVMGTTPVEARMMPGALRLLA